MTFLSTSMKYRLESEPLHRSEHLVNSSWAGTKISKVYRAVLKQDLLPPSHRDPKRSAGSLIPMPYPLLVSVPTASVAIKVLHPKVETMISRDISIMRF